METKNLLDLIPKENFHSCILTTYSFDFYYFEEKVARSLRSKGISNISVLADAHMLDESLGKWTGMLSASKSLTNDYSLSGITARGVFHPKIYLMVGNSEALILLGSGNLTASGHGKNHEVWTAFNINGENHPLLPLFYQVWHYLVKVYNQVEGVSKQKLQWIRENCNLLKTLPADEPGYFIQLTEDTGVAFLANSSEASISQALHQLVPSEEVKEITVIAPYYDEHGQALIALAETYPHAIVRVILQEKYGNPPNQIPPHDRIHFYLWEDAFEGPTKPVQHGKIFHFKTESEEYCLLGSANASVAALGRISSAAINDEFTVLLRRQQGNYLADLGIRVTGKRVDVSRLQGTNHSLVVDQPSPVNAYLTRLTAVDWKQAENALEVFVTIPVKETWELRLFDAWGEQLAQLALKGSNQKYFKSCLPDDVKHLRIAYGQIYCPTGAVSNKQVVHYVEQQYRTNPSPENRKLVRLLSSIESGLSNPFELMEFCQNIYAQKSPKEILHSSSSTAKPVKEEKAPMSYDEFLRQKESDEEFHPTSWNQHHAVQVMDTIFKLFTQEQERKAEQLADLEESTDSVTDTGSDNGTKTHQPKIFSTEKAVEVEKKKNIAFFRKYSAHLAQQAEKENHPLSLVDLSHYLIALHLIVDLLNQPVIVKKGKEEITLGVWLNKSGKYEAYDSFAPIALDVIGKFLLFCASSEGLQDSKDEYLNRKQAYYQQMARVRSLFCLSLVHQSTSYRVQLEKWVEKLYFNTRHYLGPCPQQQIEVEFPRLLPKHPITHYSLSEAFELMAKCESSYQAHSTSPISYSSSLELDQLYLTKNKGYCAIVDSLPKDLTKARTFLKLSHTGFQYDKRISNYVLDGWYRIADGRLMNAKP